MKHSIDITKKDPVSTTSTGRVSSVTWDAGESAARSKAIAEARQQAHEDHQKYLQSLDPNEARIRTLEEKVEQLLIESESRAN